MGSILVVVRARRYQRCTLGKKTGEMQILGGNVCGEGRNKDACGGPNQPNWQRP